MEKRIVFTGKHEVAVEDFTPASPANEEVAVKIICSLISSGTEMIVFNRQFSKDTHWDSWVKYPFYPGYAAVGIVTEAGKDVSRVKVGDRVALRCGHASATTVNQSECYVVPKNVASQDALWFALAKIASMALRVCDPLLGKAATIIGAGPVGQMAARWVLAAGAAPVTIIDMESKRLDFAKKGGSLHAIKKPVGDAIDELKSSNNNELPDVVIDSTGHPQVFSDALTAVKTFGQLILLGDAGRPEEQHLTPDLLMRGLRVVGAHDGHEDKNWNSEKIIPLFFNLCSSGRINVSDLVTHRFTCDQCEEAYNMLNTNRADSMGVVFEWNEE